MVDLLGPPTWFMTLNAMEFEWSDLPYFLIRRELLRRDPARVLNAELDREVKRLVRKSSKEYLRRLVARNPVACATFFSHKVSVTLAWLREKKVLG